MTKTLILSRRSTQLVETKYFFVSTFYTVCRDKVDETSRRFFKTSRQNHKKQRDEIEETSRQNQKRAKQSYISIKT